jgi:hypothetical protein
MAEKMKRVVVVADPYIHAVDDYSHVHIIFWHPSMDHILDILHEEEEDIDMNFPDIYDPEKYRIANDDDNYDEGDIHDLHDMTDGPRSRLHH